jgi:hypothetical protein
MSHVEHRRNHKSKASALYRSMISSRTKSFYFVLILFILKMLLSSAEAIVISVNNASLPNENSTIYYPIETQNSSIVEDSEDPRRHDNKPAWCECIIKFEDNENEHHCHCEGPKLLKIPQNLENITRLSISNAKFKVSEH